MLTFEQKYNLFVSRDPSVEGVFFTGVKTTNIFCRPTCSAKKPKPENIVFFDTPKQALQNGFRPCKVCRPLELPGSTPPLISGLISDIQSNPLLKIKDYDLRQRGIDPAMLRRWFKKNHNMTFHSFQRMVRINSAYKKLSEGNSVLGTALESGYDSLSGFNDSYHSVFGTSPANSKDKKVITITRFSTPLGPMYGCAVDEGICLVEFTDRRMLETEFKDLCRLINGVILPGSHPLLDLLKVQMDEYFAGSRTSFDLPLYTPGTPFRRSVWELLKKIPYGETVSYKQQAVRLNNPDAVRAVASANGHNRIAVIIPCHRVIGEDGSMTGYAGGIPRKQWLLDFERKNLESKSAKTEAFVGSM